MPLKMLCMLCIKSGKENRKFYDVRRQNGSFCLKRQSAMRQVISVILQIVHSFLSVVTATCTTYLDASNTSDAHL